MVDGAGEEAGEGEAEGDGAGARDASADYQEVFCRVGGGGSPGVRTVYLSIHTAA